MPNELDYVRAEISELLDECLNDLSRDELLRLHVLFSGYVHTKASIESQTPVAPIEPSPGAFQVPVKG